MLNWLVGFRTPHNNPCKQTNKQHRTNLLQIAGPLEWPATCSYTQPDKTWVECGSSLTFIPLWIVAYYVFLRTFHFSLSSSLPFPEQQVMAPQTPQPSVIESELSRTTGGSSNAPLAESHQQHRHQLVHRDSAIEATENMAQDPHWKQQIKPDAAIIGSSMQSDVSSSTSAKSICSTGSLQECLRGCGV